MHGQSTGDSPENASLVSCVWIYTWSFRAAAHWLKSRLPWNLILVVIVPRAINPAHVECMCIYVYIYYCICNIKSIQNSWFLLRWLIFCDLDTPSAFLLLNPQTNMWNGVHTIILAIHSDNSITVLTRLNSIDLNDIGVPFKPPSGFFSFATGEINFQRVVCLCVGCGEHCRRFW